MNISLRRHKNELIREWQNCGIEYAVGNDRQRAAAKARSVELLSMIDRMTKLEQMAEDGKVDNDVWGDALR